MSQLNRRLARLERSRDPECVGFMLFDGLSDFDGRLVGEWSKAWTTLGTISRKKNETVEAFKARVEAAVIPGRPLRAMSDEELSVAIDSIAEGTAWWEVQLNAAHGKDGMRT